MTSLHGWYLSAMGLGVVVWWADSYMLLLFNMYKNSQIYVSINYKYLKKIAFIDRTCQTFVIVRVNFDWLNKLRQWNSHKKNRSIR